MMKKTYLLLFCLLLGLRLSAQTYTYADGSGVTWKFTVSGSEATITGETQGRYSFSGALNIPSTVSTGGNTYTVTAIGNYAFQSYAGATSLMLPASLKTIGNSAFGNCTRFTGSLTIPDAVTTIGDQAFFGCTGFTGSLTIGNAVTTIGNNAFGNCTGFTGSLTIPDAVTTIGISAFSGCSGFTGSLTIGNAVTTIGISAFYGCTGFTGSPTIGNAVTTIGDQAFYACRGFTGSLTIPDAVTTIGKSAFSLCSGLESVTFENGSAYTYATGNDQVWYNCFALKYIDMTGVASPVAATTVQRGFGTTSPFAGTLPYTVVYLPAGSTAATAGEVNFVIGSSCDNFVVYDYDSDYKNGAVGCDYPIQHDFTATTATYANRTFSGTNCKTLCLPYPATLPSGMIAYKLVHKNSNNQFFFTSLTQESDGTTALSANTPYLVRITDGASHTFGTDNNVQVPVPTTLETAASGDATSFFGGTMENIDNATAAGMNIYNLSNDTWMPIKTDNTNGYVHSFRAYVRTTGSFPVNGFSLVLDDDTTTGIDALEQDVEQGAGEIFTLDGRSVGHDLMNKLKGGEIYIKNGKKFYKF